MRICLFTPNFLPSIGGAERAADTIARGLIDRGHQATVLCQRLGKHPDVPYPVRRYRRPPAQHLWPEYLIWPVWRAYRAWRFEVVLAIYGYPTGYAAGLIKHRLGFKVLVNSQGGDMYPNFHALNKTRVSGIIRTAYRQADRVLPVSQWIASRIQEVCGGQGGLPPIDVVYNGVDLNKHDRLRDESRAKQITLAGSPPLEKNGFVLHLARVHPVKRQELAVQAVHRLRWLFESCKLKYAIVGDGQAMPEIRRLIDRLKLNDIVLTLGSRVGLEKAWLYDNALLTVATSREEGLPHTVVEAMASGLPIVASDIGPHRELIQDQGWGMLFRNGGVDDLTQKLHAMIDSDLSPMRQRAMKLRHHYALEKMIDGYEQACQRAIGQSSLNDETSTNPAA